MDLDGPGEPGPLPGPLSQLDRQVYPPGAAVGVDLRLRQGDPQPADLRVKLNVLDAATAVVAVLPERKLTQLTGRAIVPLSWDPSSHPDAEYELRAIVKGPNDLILDRERTEFRRQFGAVPAGGSFTFDAEWVAASLHPRNCQFLVCAEFDGQTTAMRTVADWSTAPLAWEWVDVEPGLVELEWWSVAGGRYAVEFTPELGVMPFETVLDGIEALPPRNTVRLDTTGPSGFYRLSEVR